MTALLLVSIGLGCLLLALTGISLVMRYHNQWKQIDTLNKFNEDNDDTDNEG